MIKFAQVVKIKVQSCSSCFSANYILPCLINAEIEGYLKTFGKPVYNLGSIKLLKIISADGFEIEGKLGTKLIKFSMPKNMEKVAVNKIKRKNEFEKCLASWISSVVKIAVEI